MTVDHAAAAPAAAAAAAAAAVSQLTPLTKPHSLQINTADIASLLALRCARLRCRRACETGKRISSASSSAASFRLVVAPAAAAAAAASPRMMSREWLAAYIRHANDGLGGCAGLEPWIGARHAINVARKRRKWEGVEEQPLAFALGGCKHPVYDINNARDGLIAPCSESAHGTGSAGRWIASPARS
jgi:hypothetical protein